MSSESLWASEDPAKSFEKVLGEEVRNNFEL